MFIYLNVFESALTAALSSTATSFSLQDDICARVGNGNYTYLQISDGIGYEIVKVSCAGGVATLTRGQSGTTATSFGIGACVAFRLNQAVIEELHCSITCDGATSEFICELVTTTPSFLTITDVNECGKQIDFSGYTEGLGIDITGKVIKLDLCSHPDLDALENSQKIAVCDGSTVYLTTIAELCNFILSKLDAPVDYVANVTEGTGINVTGTLDNISVALEPIYASDQNICGATFNRYGQLTSYPAGWGCKAEITPDGIFENATVVVSNGEITSVASGTTSGAVDSVTSDATGSVVVSGTVADPQVGLPVQGFTPGVFGPFTINQHGIITALDPTYTFFNGVDGVAPIEVNLVGNRYEVSHADSTVTAGNYEAYRVDETGHITEARNVHTPTLMGTGAFGIIDLDEDGHVIANGRMPYMTAWAGTSAGGENHSNGLTVAVVAADILDYTFTTPAPNATYTVTAVDDNGNRAIVSNRSANGFRLDMTANPGTYYITTTAMP